MLHTLRRQVHLLQRITAAAPALTPSYAPVDINAATHTVVRGDTVYNISKRYNITQDNLRAWNNLADNTISIGRTLRVKPEGYVAPAASANKPSTQQRQPLLRLKHSCQYTNRVYRRQP